MLKLSPILLAVAYGLVMYMASAWRLKRELDARSVELADPRLARVLAPMAEVLGVARIPVYLYQIAPVNGLAAPDGRIFLTQGFYDRFRKGEVSAEELASVVAHELGHVALGHARRRMIDFSGQNAIRAASAMLIARVLPGAALAVAGLLTTLLAARLSRQDEYEADAWAAALLTRSGIGTQPQKALLAKLETLTGAAGQPPAWFLSHPKSAERIAAIQRLEARWT